ncbi:uncharacterized protein LOC144861631 [Branchiostoma floridae x Branchiostoma japonicum]
MQKIEELEKEKGRWERERQLLTEEIEDLKREKEGRQGEEQPDIQENEILADQHLSESQRDKDFLQLEDGDKNVEEVREKSEKGLLENPVQKGSWVGVWYSDPVPGWYPGEVLQVYKRGKAKVQFIHPDPSSGTGKYMRPENTDIDIVPQAFIIATNLDVVEYSDKKYEVRGKKNIDKKFKAFKPPRRL